MPDGSLEVMLLTSRETRRWIIPKGWPMPGRTPAESAAQEAVEEGGLTGRIGQISIGTYRYGKRLGERGTLECQVEVFPLEVEAQLASWPEQKQRETCWMALRPAADAVQEPELAAIILDLPARLAGA
jgi:8-oxo-dGTP pyrophosphatase MutT (NUDIX family)